MVRWNNRRMSDQVDSAAAVADEVSFGWSPRRFLVVRLVWGLVGAVGGVAMILLLLLPADLAEGRRLGGPGVDFVLIFVPGYAICFAGLSVLFARRRPPWLRMTASGMELAEERRDPVFIPWSAVSSARLRWGGPLASLRITVTDPEAVVRGNRGGRRPRRRRRRGQLIMIAEVGVLQVGPATIRAELDRRGCTVQE